MQPQKSQIQDQKLSAIQLIRELNLCIKHRDCHYITHLQHNRYYQCECLGQADFGPAVWAGQQPRHRAAVDVSNHQDVDRNQLQNQRQANK